MSNSTQTENSSTSKKTPFIKRHMVVLVALSLGLIGSFALGHMVGHRQGLTAIGLEADAKQLNEIVKQQKNDLELISKQFNSTVQERDVAVSNANKFYQAFNDEKARTTQLESMNTMFTDLLRERGGVDLTVQNIQVKPLPDNAFEYAVDLVQISPKNTPAQGSVELRLIREGETLAIPMENRLFKFNTYERLTGRWTMPKGFTPQYIEVRLLGIGVSAPVVRRFSWRRGKETVPASQVISEIPQTKANAK